MAEKKKRIARSDGWNTVNRVERIGWLRRKEEAAIRPYEPAADVLVRVFRFEYFDYVAIATNPGFEKAKFAQGSTPEKAVSALSQAVGEEYILNGNMLFGFAGGTWKDHDTHGARAQFTSRELVSYQLAKKKYLEETGQTDARDPKLDSRQVEEIRKDVVGPMPNFVLENAKLLVKAPPVSEGDFGRLENAFAGL